MSSRSPTNLDELVRAPAPNPDGMLELVLPEIGGGKLVPRDLSAIEASPDSTALKISGLEQTTFDQLVARYGSQFSAVYFWKCPRIVDFTALEQLANLKLAAFFWNQRTTLEPVWSFADRPIGEGDRQKDVLVVGKRKPWLNSKRDAQRIERYVGVLEDG